MVQDDLCKGFIFWLAFTEGVNLQDEGPRFRVVEERAYQVCRDAACAEGYAHVHLALHRRL
jgi:hypothetical protein